MTTSGPGRRRLPSPADIADSAGGAPTASSLGRRSRRTLAACLLLAGVLGATAEPNTFSCLSRDPAQPFRHPGALHSEPEFAWVRYWLAAQQQPWTGAMARLKASPYASASYRPHPLSEVYRGNGPMPQNYGNLYRDAAAAYQLALRWRLTNETQYAQAAIGVLDGWAQTLTLIGGTADRFLLAGLQGYQLANAAEIMRTYDGWNRTALAQFQRMMLDLFYVMNHDFLVKHNGAIISHYWANWDLCNIASVIAIGILCDRYDIYQEGRRHSQSAGAGRAHWLGGPSVTVYLFGYVQFQPLPSGTEAQHRIFSLFLL